MEDTVKQLIKYVVETFAEKKDEIEYIYEEKETVDEVTVKLAPDDKGKIAKALRTLVGATTPRGAKRCNVEIKEKD